ncbi:hypothetical protein [Capnocytophaga sp.]|uniref:hypothetical protein n=1 Tax=Capnocytophaga sp. TaxID=44737 RepID=UPI0026DC21B1|nr:hypothetical protein [Capnocytophaga sp.]MDO5104458.1 hypothetical protein [Capnocytophaga sp.]
MEIPEIIVNQALRYDSTSVHTELVYILQKLDNVAIKYFINKQENDTIWTVNNEIRSLISKNINSIQLNDNEIINSISQIIVTTAQYFRKGILETDIKAILIFLNLNAYLRINIDNYLITNNLHKNNIESLAKKITQTLKEFNFSVEILAEAPLWEKEIFDDFQNGFSEDNISKTYRFITCVEHSGTGFYLNFFTENLILFLHKIHFKSFVNTLSLLQNPIECTCYLQLFNKEILLKIANEPNLTNKWLNFEFIRQITEKENLQIIDSEVISVKNILERIGRNDFNFLRQTAVYFRGNRLVNAALGALLSSCENTKIEAITTDFSVNQHHSNAKARNEFLRYFERFATAEQFTFLLERIFEKWKHCVKDILAENKFQNEILFTDFSSYIIKHHTLKTNNEELLSLMKSLMDKIENLDLEWFSSSCNQLTKFHIYHSQLHLLTFVYKNKNLNDIETANKYNKLISNNIQLLRYTSTDTRIHFQKGKENMEK